MVSYRQLLPTGNRVQDQKGVDEFLQKERPTPKKINWME